MEYEEMNAMVNTHECAMCGNPLTLTWDAVDSVYDLYCGKDRKHQGYRKHNSPQTLVTRGAGDKVLGAGGQASMETALARAKHPLSLMSRKDLGNGHDVNDIQVKELVAWGESLGLKPYLGHVCLYFGKPYPTIDAYYYRLNHDRSPIRISTRPLNGGERDDYQVKPGDHAWIAESWIDDIRMHTTGFGLVTKDEIEGKSKHDADKFQAPVAHDHPQRMAEKRAEWQLLRKLVPLGEAKEK